jgi:hypothetical protein
MTREICAADLGLNDEDAATFAALTTDDGAFPLGRQLGLWEQWVRELDSGSLWHLVELEAACDARDDLDVQISSLPERLAIPIFDFVERLDRVFRDQTVNSTLFADRRTNARWWWWGRVPIRSGQRLFLLKLWEPDRYATR